MLIHQYHQVLAHQHYQVLAHQYNHVLTDEYYQVLTHSGLSSVNPPILPSVNPSILSSVDPSRVIKGLLFNRVRVRVYMEKHFLEVFVQTKLYENTEGKYFPVQTEQTRLISYLYYMAFGSFSYLFLPLRLQASDVNDVAVYIIYF